MTKTLSPTTLPVSGLRRRPCCGCHAGDLPPPTTPCSHCTTYELRGLWVHFSRFGPNPAARFSGPIPGSTTAAQCDQVKSQSATRDAFSVSGSLALRRWSNISTSSCYSCPVLPFPTTPMSRKKINLICPSSGVVLSLCWLTCLRLNCLYLLPV